MVFIAVIAAQFKEFSSVFSAPSFMVAVFLIFYVILNPSHT